ncbi:hypothetical protein Y032_0166g74 [Ancylostoma ceylanicum]|nr:hypothetical protein Y032_0166g74 [Ancylostoma ceylanicum]
MGMAGGPNVPIRVAQPRLFFLHDDAHPRITVNSQHTCVIAYIIVVTMSKIPKMTNVLSAFSSRFMLFLRSLTRIRTLQRNVAQPNIMAANEE